MANHSFAMIGLEENDKAGCRYTNEEFADIPGGFEQWLEYRQQAAISVRLRQAHSSPLSVARIRLTSRPRGAADPPLVRSVLSI